MNKYRTHNCSELSEKEIGKVVSLSGWLHRKRDHGNLLFIDLRDHFGLTQCVIENNNEFFSDNLSLSEFSLPRQLNIFSLFFLKKFIWFLSIENKESFDLIL